MDKPVQDNLDQLRRQLRRLVESGEQEASGAGLEKRRHERHLYTVEARIRYVKRFGKVSDSPSEFVVFTKDLSRSGISFLHNHEMYAGEIIEVEVDVQGTKRLFMIRIVRCRRAGLKVFSIAGEFVSEEEAAQVDPDPAQSN